MTVPAPKPGEPTAPRAKAAVFLARQSKLTLTALSMVIAVLLGIVDFATGFELSFALFYLIPVFLAAWFAGARAGAAVSLFSAATWQVANIVAGETFSRSFVPFWNSATRLSFFVIVTVLATKLKAALERERALSRTDFLTGALNGRAFFELLGFEVSRAKRKPRAFSLAYLDVDDFKAVNDQQGHTRGDELLRAVAETLSGQLRKLDVFARLGGDEFAILLPETDAAGAAVVLPKIHGALARLVARHGWPVSFSVGVVTCIDPPDSADALVTAADNVMYHVKRDGKNAIRYVSMARGVESG